VGCENVAVSTPTATEAPPPTVGLCTLNEALRIEALMSASGVMIFGAGIENVAASTLGLTVAPPEMAGAWVENAADNTLGVTFAVPVTVLVGTENVAERTLADTVTFVAAADAV